MKELGQIVDQIKVVYAECINLKTDLLNKIALAISDGEKQKEDAKKLRRRKQLLDEREVKLEKIEDVVQHRKDSDLRMEQGQAVINEYTIKVNSFTAYEDSKKKEIDGKEIQLNKREKKITDREASLEQIIVDNVRKAIKQWE